MAIALKDTFKTKSETALKDNRSQQIDSTYIKDISITGTTITVTKGNDNTSTEVTQDTHVGLTDSLTSTSNTTALTAKQGNLLATGSARDSTKVMLDGSSTMTGALKTTSVVIQGSTTNNNTYDAVNPKITFKNVDGSQNAQLIFSDYDSLIKPASLTFIGNQGGEYFIAPNIKATGAFIGALSGNADTSTKASYLQTYNSSGTANTGSTKMYAKNDGTYYHLLSEDNTKIKADAATTDASGNVITSTYATKEELKQQTSTLFKYKGSCTYTQLIAKTDAIQGDVYNVTDRRNTNYVCIVSNTTGENAWDNLGEYLDLSPYATNLTVSGHTLSLNNGSTSLATVTLPDNNTLNTAGSTNDTTNKLFIVGAKTQASSGVTYSNSNVYISGNKLYSNAKEVSTTDHTHDTVYSKLGHTHNYAGSSSAGGAATSANKINTDAGSATQPVYFSNGVPVATTYSLGKSVPSNAVFTDTTYPLYYKIIDNNFKTNFRIQTYGTKSDGTYNNGNYITVIRNNTGNVTDAPQHSSGIAFGMHDTHGYLYTAYGSAVAYIGGGNAGRLNWVKQIAFKENATTSTAGLMSSADKAKLDGIATNANNYTHPTYTSKSSGFYKVTVDSTGHVSGATSVVKKDITDLGVPAQDTTYSAGTGLSLTGTRFDVIKASNIALGGVAVGYSEPTGATNRNYKLQIDTNGNAFVNVPWTSYTFNGAISTVKDSNLTADRALISSSTGKIAVSAVTSTELSYLDGVTSNVQTQLNNKVNTTADGVATFTIGYQRPVANGGNGKQWSRLCLYQDNTIDNGSRWYGAMADISFWCNGYGSNANYTYLGTVSLCVTAHNQGTFVNEHCSAKWRDNKINIWSPEHIKIVKTKTTVEFFIKNDIWDTAIYATIIKRSGLTIRTAADQNTQYTDEEFTTYCSDKTVVNAILDNNLYVGNLNYFKNTSTTDVGINDVTANAIGYVADKSLENVYSHNDGATYKQVYNNAWSHQIYGDYRTGQIALRAKNNGTWTGWRSVLDSGNFSNYALSLSGGTVSGTIAATTVQTSLQSKNGRMSSLDKAHQYPNNRVSMDLDISSSTNGSSPCEGYVQTYFWDNNGHWDSQLLLPAGQGERIRYRTKDGQSTWSNNWKSIPFTDDVLLKNARNNIRHWTGDGKYTYAKIMTIQVKASYADSPITLRMAGRGYRDTKLDIIYSSYDGTDPNPSAYMDGTIPFWLGKVAAGKWELWAQFNEAWGFFDLITLNNTGSDKFIITIGTNDTNHKTTALPTFVATAVRPKKLYTDYNDLSNKPTSMPWDNVTGKPTTFPAASHTHSYLPLSGGTLTGSVTFANNTLNLVGDDCYMGDFNKPGTFGIKGNNGTTTLGLIKNGSNDNADYAAISYAGSSINVNKPLNIQSGATLRYNSTDKCIEFVF